MEDRRAKGEPQRILVFQQNGSGKNKIRGIGLFGGDRFEVETCDIDEALPDVVENGGEYLPRVIAADLVLDYLKHPDLSSDLWSLCSELKIPVIASNRRTTRGCVITPRICCALPRREDLGEYGRIFGTPEFETVVVDGRVSRITVLHGAPCGATWEAAKQTVGIRMEDAPVHIGLEAQFFCTADPAGWDVLYGRSPVHFSGELHRAALERAIAVSRSRGSRR